MKEFPFHGLFVDIKKGKLQQKTKAKMRELFQDEHIQTIFSAPLFLGSASKSPSEKWLSGRDRHVSRGLRHLIWMSDVDPDHPTAP